eukprot:4829324-Ditylum_brightwellii.AAC.1
MHWHAKLCSDQAAIVDGSNKAENMKIESDDSSNIELCTDDNDEDDNNTIVSCERDINIQS